MMIKHKFKENDYITTHRFGVVRITHIAGNRLFFKTGGVTRSIKVDEATPITLDDQEIYAGARVHYLGTAWNPEDFGTAIRPHETIEGAWWVKWDSNGSELHIGDCHDGDNYVVLHPATSETPSLDESIKNVEFEIESLKKVLEELKEERDSIFVRLVYTGNGKFDLQYSTTEPKEDRNHELFRQKVNIKKLDKIISEKRIS